jgi:hypothetical protein
MIDALGAEECGWPADQSVSDVVSSLVTRFDSVLEPSRQKLSHHPRRDVLEARTDWLRARWIRSAIYRVWINAVYAEVAEIARLQQEGAELVDNSSVARDGSWNEFYKRYAAHIGLAERRTYTRFARSKGLEELFVAGDFWADECSRLARYDIRLEFSDCGSWQEVIDKHQAPLIYKMVDFARVSQHISIVVRANTLDFSLLLGPFLSLLTEKLHTRDKARDPWELWYGHIAEMAKPAGYKASRTLDAIIDGSAFRDDVIEAYLFNEVLNGMELWNHRLFSDVSTMNGVSNCAGQPVLRVMLATEHTARWLNAQLAAGRLAVGRSSSAPRGRTLGASASQAFLFGEVGRAVFGEGSDFSLPSLPERETAIDRRGLQFETLLRAPMENFQLVGGCPTGF